MRFAKAVVWKISNYDAIDEAFLDALGADRIPDPTTAGDFCRRFDSRYLVGRLHDAIDEARLTVWKRQPEAFFEQAIIDMDGHLVATTGQCKEGMETAYDGTWGYHPLLLSLANTGEVSSILNRPGNYTSEDGAAAQCDRAIALCRRAGFAKILLRGDTAFSQTEHLDRWAAEGVEFHFDEVRYFFYITNDRQSTPAQVVFSCNDRCHQENLIEQLSYGPRVFRAPVDNLYSNWAYMVMTALAWNLKAWSALWLPETGRWAERRRTEKQKLLRMEFRTFINTMIKIPCQIVRTGGRLVYRLLSWNRWLPVFRRLAIELHC